MKAKYQKCEGKKETPTGGVNSKAWRGISTTPEEPEARRRLARLPSERHTPDPLQVLHLLYSEEYGGSSEIPELGRNLVIPIPYYSIAGGGKETIRHQGNPGVHTGSETSQELHKQQQQGVLKPHIPDIRLGANEYSSSRRECAALQISPLETSLLVPQQQEHNKCGEE